MNMNIQKPTWEKIDSLAHAKIIEHIMTQGFAPKTRDLAEELAVTLPILESSVERLSENHALVLHPGTHDVWIIHPFSLSPTATWVESSERGWWAPCMWCAFGISTLVRGDLTIHASEGGESEKMLIRFRDGRLIDREYFVHFPIPPRHAWSNVHHFCSSVLPFKNAEEVGDWGKRHGLPVGQIITTEKLFELATKWYGRHKDVDWVKWTSSEAQNIFDQVGLTGEFWNLGSHDGRY
jgi:hypothetical protein